MGNFIANLLEWVILLCILWVAIVILLISWVIIGIIGKAYLIRLELIHRGHFKDLRALSSKFFPHFFDQDDESVVAFRYAYLVLKNGVCSFASITQKTTFGRTERARCNLHNKSSHMAPNKDCVCGLYALKDASNLPKRVVTARVKIICVLQVQLSGTYIPGKDGYRAERQDILCVWLPHECSVFWCHEPTSIVAAVAVKGLTAIPALSSSDSVLVPVCEKHAKNYSKTFSLLDLRNQIHTEFQLIR